MSDQVFKTFQVGFVVYLVMIVICFGPATVQSEKASAEYQARCRAEKAGDAEAVRWCSLSGPSIADGAPKAIFWPLWLSYVAASR
jgi:hypothetical protein